MKRRVSWFRWVIERRRRRLQGGLTQRITATDERRAAVRQIAKWLTRRSRLNVEPLGRQTDMLETIIESWGWTGLEPAAVMATNAFGNLLVHGKDGAYMRICPEQLSCEVVAHDDAEFEALWADEDFQLDWQMTRLVELAKAMFGTVDNERCYCLKLPAVLGGKYDAANFGTITRRELIAFTGDVAQQVKDVPDGGSVKFEWLE